MRRAFASSSRLAIDADPSDDLRTPLLQSTPSRRAALPGEGLVRAGSVAPMHGFLAAARRQWRWGLVGSACSSWSACRRWSTPCRSSGRICRSTRWWSASRPRPTGPTTGTRRPRSAPTPELPGAADLSTLVSDTSRMRLWYDGPDAWRTDLLYSGGERDRYGQPDGMWVWDSGTHRSVFVQGETQLRLPIPIDLTPPGPGSPAAGRGPARRAGGARRPPHRRTRRRRGADPALGLRRRPSTPSTSGPIPRPASRSTSRSRPRAATTRHSTPASWSCSRSAPIPSS